MDVGTQDSPGADRPKHAKTRRVGRRRVVLAVVCLAMGVLLSVAGVVSGWRGFGYDGGLWAVQCGNGRIAVIADVDRGQKISARYRGLNWENPRVGLRL